MVGLSVCGSAVVPVDAVLSLIRDIPDAKEVGLSHLCEFIEDCEFTYLSTQVL